MPHHSTQSVAVTVTATPAAVPSASVRLPPEPFEDIHQVGAPEVRFVDLPGDGTYDAYVTYPELTYADPLLSAWVNARIRRDVQARRAEWEKYLASDRLPGTRAYRVDACSVMYASTTAVSVSCDIYEFNGGMHGSKNSATLNLRLPDLRAIAFDQVFRRRSSLRQILMGLCDKSLAEAGPYWDPPQPDASMHSEFGDGVEPTFETFAMTERGLIFYFKDQLPHVTADVVIPSVEWADLGEILQPEARVLASPDIPFVRARAPFGPWDKRR